jgi:hypothetical protein
MDSLFSVLQKENCVVFYFLSILSLVLFVGALIFGVFYSKEKWKTVLLSSLGPLWAYYMYRLFYSMCEGSLH